MALRVLLADNSETIKKVIQLTLQDYAIDLRAVNLGVDVMDVALKFKPDIVFIDILLQKKSGYEVSKEIKSHPQLSQTPVVLMWSGFMEFDEQKAKESLADAKIEKPFDAQVLRDLVNKLVNKTKNNPLSSFLDLPLPPTPPQETAAKASTSPAKGKYQDPLKELEQIQNEALKFTPPTANATHLNEDLPNISLDDDSLAEEFEMKLLQPSSKVDQIPLDSEQTKSFILNLPEDALNDDIPIDMEKIDKIENTDFLLKPGEDKTKTLSKPSEQTNTAKPIEKTVVAPREPSEQKTNLPDAAQIEKIIREQASEIIEKVAWQIIPELASQIIKKELDRLLKDADKNA